MMYAIPRVIVCFLLSVLVSTLLIRYGFGRLRKDVVSKEGVHRLPLLAFWIYFLEAILVFVFVIENQYTAVALVLAAILVVAKDRMADDPVLYLVGPLCNTSVAVVFAVIARIWISGSLLLLLV
jgi:hypothetical protein